jgi:hypothetical protein
MIYLLVASIALAVAFVRSHTRAWKIARLAALLASGTLAVTVAFFLYWDEHGSSYSGSDWVDQLTYPWGITFLAGCWWLARVR